MRSYDKAGVVEAIRAAGGEVYGVTSEPQNLADRAKDSWALGFDCIGDPHQEISGVARDRGWLDLYVNKTLEFLKASATHFDPQHPKGYLQPGVLVVSREGRVLYRWRCVPSRKNVGGAMARPTPEHVLESVRTALASGADADDAAHDDHPELDSPAIPWPLFVAALIANGWFVKPVAFEQRATGPTPLQRIKIAAMRLVGFVSLWGLAFALLPTLLVTLAFAGWVAWITPKVRWLNREFQNIAPG